MEEHFEVELIIFDMDGLMLDTERIAFTGWKEAAAKYGYQIEEELYLKTLGMTPIKTREIYMNHFGDKFAYKEIRAERMRIAEEIIKTKGVPVKRGLYDLINYLNKINMKKAVATSTSRDNALSLLKLAQIDNFFDCIVCGDEVVNSKPNPEIFMKVADKLNCSYNKCLVLEDSEAGITAAHEAGMLSIAIPDMKEPSNEVQKLAFKRMNSLIDVQAFLEESLSESFSA
jgi:HAD superfamily hydrolase (TIGR01509 family)